MRLCALALLASGLCAQSLVKDIAAGLGVNPSSSPGIGILYNGNYYFSANDGVSGAELWRTNGTAAGTLQVRDINPGSVSSSPGNFYIFNGLLYFSASDGVNGIELWQTNGTSVGTVLIKDIYPGASSGSPSLFTAVGGTLFFSGFDGTATTGTGRELWKSDGTAAGTVLVKDIWVGTSSSSPANLVALGTSVYFSASDGTTAPGTGTELWVSDGTAAGTTQVKDINVGTLSSSPSQLRVFGGKLLFSASDGTTAPATGTELWTSDGTAAGTVQVLDINTGTVSSSPSSFVDFAGAVYFSALTAANGRELWKTDGTAAGTVLVADVYAGASTGISSTAVNALQVAGPTLFFRGTDAVNGTELWKSDGTAAGTSLVVDLSAGVTSSTFNNLIAMGAVVLFDHLDTVNGRELWTSNGTAAGTVLVRDINATAAGASSNPSAFAVVGATLYFSATDGVVGTELWSSDGTTAGTGLVRDIALPQPASSNPANFATSAAGRTLFAANDNVNGTELWTTDGTTANTSLLLDINTTTPTASSSPANLFAYKGGVLFTATNGVNGIELWFSDGTAAGTTMLADIYPGASSSSPGNFTLFKGQVFFTASNSTATTGIGNELWKTDGTAAGTVLVLDIYTGTSSSSPSLLTVAGNQLFFTALTAAAGRELWVTDGTTAGTVMVADIYAGTSSGASSSTRAMAPLGNRVLFAGSDATNGQEIWVSDGTAAGTTLVKDIYVGASGSGPWPMNAFNGKVVFEAQDGTTGFEPWITDGTAAGTLLLKDIYPGTTSGFSISPTVATPTKLFFIGNDGLTGSELWVTDGTPAGTVQVLDIRAGAASGTGTSPRMLQAGSGDYCFVVADDGVTGAELWLSNGTPAGTSRLFDLNPGNLGAGITGLGRNGTTMLLGATDGVAGVELFKFPLSITGTSLVDYVGRGCPGTGGLIPQMVAGGGLPVLGNAGFTVGVTNANVSAPCSMFLSAAINPTPLGGGCVFYTVPALISLNTSTNAAGNASIPVAIPNVPAYAGAELAFQYVVLDPNGAYFNLVSLSDALLMMIGK